MARTYDDILLEAWDRKCHPNAARAPGQPNEWGEPLRSIVFEAMRVAAADEREICAIDVGSLRQCFLPGIGQTVLDSACAFLRTDPDNKPFPTQPPRDWRDVPVTVGMLADVFDAFCGADGHNLVVKVAADAAGTKLGTT